MIVNRRLSNLLTEIDILKTLDHNNIIKLYGVYNTAKQVILNTEFCGENNLQNYLNHYNNIIRLSEVRDILVSLANALKYLHSKGVSHRDIKLENILIKQNGIVKLIDFGFAVVNENRDALLDNYCGTPAYMSPEIVERKLYDGHKADMWALGVLMYRIVSGKFPFTESAEIDLYSAIISCEARICSSVPQKLRSLILRLLEKNPVNRPSADEILADEWVMDA